MEKNITVYGKKGCTPCATLKAMLEQKGIKYQYIDVMENFDVISENNIKSVPTTRIVEGDSIRFVVGNKIEEILA